MDMTILRKLSQKGDWESVGENLDVCFEMVLKAISLIILKFLDCIFKFVEISIHQIVGFHYQMIKHILQTYGVMLVCLTIYSISNNHFFIAQLDFIIFKFDLSKMSQKVASQNEYEEEEFIGIHEKNHHDYYLIKEQLQSCIKEEIEELDLSAIAQEDRFRFRTNFHNLLIENANRILASYRKHIKIEKNLIQQNNVTLPPNENIQKTNTIRLNILQKAIQRNKQTEPSEIPIDIQIKNPENLYVIQDQNKVNINNLMPKLNIEEYQRKCAYINQREQLLNINFSRIELMIEQSQNEREQLEKSNFKAQNNRGKKNLLYYN